VAVEYCIFVISSMNRVDLKVVLLGNATVGKTSLMERYVHDTFNDSRPYQNVSIIREHITYHSKKGRFDTKSCETKIKNNFP